MLPACDAAEAERRAQELRLRVSQASTQWPAPMTLSIGAVTDVGGEQLPALLEAADRALYDAKTSGRDTVRHGALQRRVDAVS